MVKKLFFMALCAAFLNSWSMEQESNNLVYFFNESPNDVTVKADGERGIFIPRHDINPVAVWQKTNKFFVTGIFKRGDLPIDKSKLQKIDDLNISDIVLITLFHKIDKSEKGLESAIAYSAEKVQKDFIDEKKKRYEALRSTPLVQIFNDTYSNQFASVQNREGTNQGYVLPFGEYTRIDRAPEINTLEVLGKDFSNQIKEKANGNEDIYFEVINDEQGKTIVQYDPNGSKILRLKNTFLPHLYIKNMSRYDLSFLKKDKVTPIDLASGDINDFGECIDADQQQFLSITFSKKGRKAVQPQHIKEKFMPLLNPIFKEVHYRINKGKHLLVTVNEIVSAAKGFSVGVKHAFETPEEIKKQTDIGSSGIFGHVEGKIDLKKEYPLIAKMVGKNEAHQNYIGSNVSQDKLEKYEAALKLKSAEGLTATITSAVGKIAALVSGSETPPPSQEFIQEQLWDAYASKFDLKVNCELIPDYCEISGNLFKRQPENVSMHTWLDSIQRPAHAKMSPEQKFVELQRALETYYIFLMPDGDLTSILFNFLDAVNNDARMQQAIRNIRLLIPSEKEIVQEWATDDRLKKHPIQYPRFVISLNSGKEDAEYVYSKLRDLFKDVAVHKNFNLLSFSICKDTPVCYSQYDFFSEFPIANPNELFAKETKLALPKIDFINNYCKENGINKKYIPNDFLLNVEPAGKPVIFSEEEKRLAEQKTAEEKHRQEVERLQKEKEKRVAAEQKREEELLKMRGGHVGISEERRKALEKEQKEKEEEEQEKVQIPEPAELEIKTFDPKAEEQEITKRLEQLTVQQKEEEKQRKTEEDKRIVEKEIEKQSKKQAEEDEKRRREALISLKQGAEEEKMQRATGGFWQTIANIFGGIANFFKWLRSWLRG